MGFEWLWIDQQNGYKMTRIEPVMKWHVYEMTTILEVIAQMKELLPAQRLWVLGPAWAVMCFFLFFAVPFFFLSKDTLHLSFIWASSKLLANQYTVNTFCCSCNPE